MSIEQDFNYLFKTSGPLTSTGQVLICSKRKQRELPLFGCAKLHAY